MPSSAECLLVRPGRNLMSLKRGIYFYFLALLNPVVSTRNKTVTVFKQIRVYKMPKLSILHIINVSCNNLKFGFVYSVNFLFISTYHFICSKNSLSITCSRAYCSRMFPYRHHLTRYSQP